MIALCKFGLFPTLISAIHTTNADSEEDFSQEKSPSQASINSVTLTLAPSRPTVSHATFFSLAFAQTRLPLREILPFSGINRGEPVLQDNNHRLAE